MNNKQIEQIYHFLTAYPKDVVEAGIEAWRNKKPPYGYETLTDKVDIPCPKCKSQLRISGVCTGCDKGKEGYRSKLHCRAAGCGYEEYFKETVNQLKGRQ